MFFETSSEKILPTTFFGASVSSSNFSIFQIENFNEYLSSRKFLLESRLVKAQTV